MKPYHVEEKLYGETYRSYLGQLHSYDDKPAIEKANGDKEWYKEGERHRENDKPAIEKANGDKMVQRRPTVHTGQ